ncbi:MFS transporter [Ureibacillus aquaedulcis]|uniref:MFS transporter n=1 Tax=Ureibacillus aquaedulcis TaxID=3058421 RepID=A0ABT8GTC5_9BACL|nr:MFS transporter [Ureibacillus sp. BA0131]MDN4494670.1 MFS transporter [Ureibacillus sp. BA0131]
MRFTNQYGLLLGGLGFSNLGNWIYLIALNLAVWHLTHSPAAVAGIYIVGPIARIISNFFAGSIIDRHDKKRLMIMSDIARGIIVCIMPLVSSVWFIYALIFLANIASSFFGPSSTYLITKLVKDEDKQRFNAINSTLSSGSFMIGPALAGGIIALSNTSVAMWINGFTFFVCAWAISLLPKVQNEVVDARNRLTVSMIHHDFKQVWAYSRKNPKLLTFLIIYITALMIAFALDSQEMTFLKVVLQTTDTTYGMVVSVAGIGAILGGICATALVNKVSLQTYIGAGFSLTMASYLSFYSSSLLWLATLSFVALGFFMAFSNTGYATLYQKTIPPPLMGRFGSSLNLLQSIAQIIFTFALGIIAEWYSLQPVTVIFSSVALVLSLYLYFYISRNAKSLNLGENDEQS